MTEPCIWQAGIAGLFGVTRARHLLRWQPFVEKGLGMNRCPSLKWLSILPLIGLITACGGDDGSGPGNSPVVAQKSVIWYDADGQAWRKVSFAYDEASFTSTARTPGPDGRWATTDDRSGTWLDCDYDPGGNEHSPQPQLFHRARGDTASGAILLAEMNMPSDGAIHRCPARSGWHLTREAFCTDFNCNSGHNGYVIRINQSSSGRRTTERQEMVDYSDGLPIGDDGSKLFSHTQTADIFLDDQGRVTRKEINVSSFLDEPLVDECADGGNFALAGILHITCQSMKEVQRLHRSDKTLTRETDHYNALSFAATSKNTRTIDYTEGVIRKGAGDTLPPSDVSETLSTYAFNRNQQITRIKQRDTGPDDQWFTPDDQIRVEHDFFYDALGDPDHVIDHKKDMRIEFRDNGQGRLKAIVASVTGEEIPRWRKEYHYENGRLTRIDLLGRFDGSDSPYLGKVMSAHYRQITAPYPERFSPQELQPVWRPTVESLWHSPD